MGRAVIVTFLYFVFVHIITTSSVLGATEKYYTAAVFEFTQAKECVETQEESDEIVQHNLEIYVRVAEHAKKRDTDIIVFPEYGIFPECLTRKSTYFFLEDIPDPTKGRFNPCENYEEYSDRPQLLTLSCMAKNHSMIVQANTGDVKHCDGQDDCPPDGRFQYNTNVVFDRDGTLLVRYHKEHLWLEHTMNKPKEKQVPVYTTDIGTFVSYVCFDLVLERTVEVARKYNADGVTFSTMWESAMPMFVTIQYFEGFSIGTGLTVLAADIQLPGQWATGSGIFHGQEGPLAYTFNPDGISKLVVSRVPRKGFALEQPRSHIGALHPNGTFYEFTSDGKNVPYEGSENILPDPQNNFTSFRYHVTDLENYTLVHLDEPSGHLDACNNGFCCSLDYSTKGLDEDFYLAVFNGSQQSFPPYFWCEEDCMLVRCDSVGDKPCAAFPMRADDTFELARLTANFSVPFVYPSVVSNRFRLVDTNKWDFSKTIQPDGLLKRDLNYHSDPGDNLVLVGMKARCYERDPPFSFY